MTVLKRGSSKFWYIQFQYNGKTYIKSSKSTDRRFAELMESQWKKQLMTNQVLGIKNRILMVDAFDLYLEAKQKLASFRTISCNVRTASKELANAKYFDEISTADLERLRMSLGNKGYEPQTIKHIVGVVRGAWKHAKRMGYQVSELEYPTIKVGKGRLRYLTLEEERRLLAANDPKRVVKGLAPYEQRTEQMRREMHDLYDFLIVLLDTGARFGEIATLKWNQINLDAGTIALWRPKVRNESILYMTDRVRDCIQRRFEAKQTEFVFGNRTGGARSYIGATLQRAFKRAGLPDCSPHTLRHTHATRLIQNGLSIYEVKEILGHSDIKTTMRYAHIEQSHVARKASAAINSLSRIVDKSST